MEVGKEETWWKSSRYVQAVHVLLHSEGCRVW